MKLLALGALLIAACGQHSGGSEAIESCASNSTHSVSIVNGWPGLDPELYATEKAATCEGLVEIEGLPWVDRSSLCDAAHPANCANPYATERRALLKAMSSHKITTYIVSQNSNAAGPWRLAEDAFRSYIRGIRKDVEDLEIEDLVWLGTPSEPWAADFRAGARRAEIIEQEWPYTIVVPDAGANHPTARPYFPAVRFDYLEVHPCSISDTLESIVAGRPILTVTDCSPVLNPGASINLGLFQEADKAGQPLIIYDAYAQ